MIDLHTHTTASDGSLTPEELVIKAHTMGLKAVGITDHDTIGGVEQAIEAGRGLDIEVVAGVELGVDYKVKGTHILGYFSHGNYKGINSYFDWILERRHERNRRMIESLQKAGFDITLKEMYEKAAGGTPGRPHLAKCLIEKGYASDVNEAFEKILLRKDIYVHREKTTPVSAIEEILKNHGVPVLAHPVYMDRVGLFEESIRELVGMGLMGIEAFHSDHNEADSEKYLKAAREYNLVVTGGSDFHGANKDNAFLGKPQVDDSYLDGLLRLL
ncbi:MAG TPA: PHP domain-containing protein [Clostridia bacterium]|nr:PHP domain-containing protein [Clostridia bacterium]HRX41325.1 PHP domain-containing protein [Clostridia bacterium]